MSEAEQDQRHGELLVRERKLEKKLACLRSKSRQTREVLTSVLHGVEGYVSDFKQLKKRYAEVSDVEISALIEQVEMTVSELFAVQKDIRAIEGRSLPHESDNAQ